MRYWLCLISIALSLPCSAQSTAPQQKVSLELGPVTVWLGMARQEVINKCASAGFKEFPGTDSFLFVDANRHYSAEFKDDRLVFAFPEELDVGLPWPDFFVGL